MEDRTASLDADKTCGLLASFLAKNRPRAAGFSCDQRDETFTREIETEQRTRPSRSLTIRVVGMALFSKKSSYDLTRTRRERRRGRRRSVNTEAFVRLEGSFAVRRCNVLDLSATGVRILLDGPDRIPNGFTLMASRSSPGRNARVKWQRGNTVGAEFI